MNAIKTIFTAIVILTITPLCLAISSSLFLAPPTQPLQPVTNARGDVSPLSPAIARASFTAVPIPTPQVFQVDDLVTIIIRESQQTQFDSTLNTEKKLDFNSDLSAFPNLQLSKLLQFQLEPSSLSKGPVKVGMTHDDKFNGTGEYQRQASMTGRITARVIDVKPNGTLVLEARKYIRSDNETLQMVLTGTCRAEDIAADNTVLSTQLYDLNLTKKHTGDTHNATKKGFLTKLLELIFNF